MDWRRETKCPCRYPSWRPLGAAGDLSAPVTFFAREPHFADHLAPVWLAMPAEVRGDFYVPERDIDRMLARGVNARCFESRGLSDHGPVAVASYGDIVRCVGMKRPLILFEHGCGFSFGTRHPSYAGGAQKRCGVGLFVGPNEYVAARNRWAFPAAPTVAVGCPKLDGWHKRRTKQRAERPVVCLSWHWDCKIAPEAGWALPHYAEALPAIVDELSDGCEVIGHGHPRASDYWKRLYDGLGVEYVPDFETVMERADLYVNDASSTLYEFASTDRPVVVMNAPWYRRSHNLGLRFWEHIPGVEVEGPAELTAAVDAALADSRELRAKRRAATDAAYTVHDGTSAAAAAQAITDWAAAGVIGRSTQRMRKVA